MAQYFIIGSFHVARAYNKLHFEICMLKPSSHESENLMRNMIKSTVNHLNETVEDSTCLISKTNTLPNISQLMLDFINCYENALRKNVSNNVFNQCKCIQWC